MAKMIRWCGSSRKDIQDLPKDAQRELGAELWAVQLGKTPNDFRAVKTVGSGVFEIRVGIDGNQFRTIYLAKFDEAIYVLHVFQKKTQKTPQKDIELARNRYKQLLKDRNDE